MSPLVQAESLRVVFDRPSGLSRRFAGVVRAVDGVSLTIFKGETLGLVGESGCGKSTLGKALLRLIEPTEGVVRFEGEDIARLPAARWRALRPRLQMVFQDPTASLNPRMTVGEAVSEPLIAHRLCSRQERHERTVSLLAEVGLSESLLDRYPNELSGGQRQRVAIARALSVRPSFVVADEPLTGLDGSVQAQIANLLVDLQEQLELAYLFISHDLRMVAHLADRVAVMYAGKLVEIGPAHRIGPRSAHPYSRALCAARAPGRLVGLQLLEGEVPDPLALPAGCRFRPRCPVARERCAQQEPALSQAGDGHSVACFWPLEPGEQLPSREIG
ncbi:MAG: ABC transporter ATP-binding protein [Myxococcales bacterium]|jgi:oligopeptide/dipeptide ABC transporter ATP-binding protein